MKLFRRHLTAARWASSGSRLKQQCASTRSSSVSRDLPNFNQCAALASVGLRFRVSRRQLDRSGNVNQAAKKDGETCYLLPHLHPSDMRLRR
ncbi:hypothetical protein E2C01_071393 [Portunus trituberculatus]|uniref:Uncharacterized protein n=1 Tax=Portunus trituberculatus TaxID=210409 RepID=A0A5B7I4V1_PORTR|nr:hypothetical protein [Portunus trituberculatus]